MKTKLTFTEYMKSRTIKRFFTGTEVDVLHTGEQKTAKKREQWGRQIEFLLSCVGYSVGLGNLWRFPYLCLQHGGGAFLIPYLIYLMICGMSLYLMETAIGQSTGLSTVRIFNMIPFFQGLGWCMVFASGIICIYYNIVIAYSLYYLGMSFHWTLPWSHCNNDWNTRSCYTYSKNLTLQNGSDFTDMTINQPRRSAAEEFWLYNVLEISEGIDVLGGVQWKIAVALLAAWLMTFVCMYKGIRSTGKVVYVTAVAPYILLTVILVRGCTLPGAWEGIKFYILPNWNRLRDINVWIAAATQIFYSLGPAWGGLITFASYNKFTHDIHRDAMIIPIICGGTSIYGGFAIFSVIGHLMYATNQTDVTQLTLQGPGLAFVAYPEALTQLPGSAIWSVLFFLMLLTLGIDSQFATLEAVTTGLVDRFPITVGNHKTIFTLLVCVAEFFLGFILATRAGFYYFELMDIYATANSIVIIGLLETIVISYMYGAKNLLNDIESMIGPLRRCTRYWWILVWCILIPLMTLVIIVSNIVSQVTMDEENRKKFPQWAIAVGWTIGSMSIVQFPILAVYAIWKNKFNWRKVSCYTTHFAYIRKCFRPTAAGSNIDKSQFVQILLNDTHFETVAFLNGAVG